MHDYSLLGNFYWKIALQYSMTVMIGKVHTQNHEISNDLGPIYLRSSLKTCLTNFYFEFYIKGILSTIAAMISFAERISINIVPFSGFGGVGGSFSFGDPRSTCNEHFPSPLMFKAIDTVMFGDDLLFGDFTFYNNPEWLKLMLYKLN